MPHLRRRGAMQLGYEGVQPTVTVSEAVAVEDMVVENVLEEGFVVFPDIDSSNLLGSLQQTLPAGQQEDEEASEATSDFDVSPYIDAWVQPADQYDLGPSNVVFTVTRSPSTRSVISVAASWQPFAPRGRPSIERVRPLFIRSNEPYLFPEVFHSPSTFTEQIAEVASIAASDMVAPSAPVNQVTPANRGVIANIRALVFFNKPRANETTASSPVPSKRPPLFRIWRRRSSNQLSPLPVNNPFHVEGEEIETASEQPIQRSRTLFFGVLAPGVGLRGKETTQTA